jgi:hypothetical protein
MAEVGIHDAERVRRRGSKSFDDRRAQTQLAGPVHDANAVDGRRQFVGQLARPIGRVVVDDHELEADAGRCGGLEQGSRQLRQPIPFVVGGQDHRQVRRARHLGTL